MFLIQLQRTTAIFVSMKYKMLKARHQRTNEFNVHSMHVTSFTTTSAGRRLFIRAITLSLRIVICARLKFMVGWSLPTKEKWIVKNRNDSSAGKIGTMQWLSKQIRGLCLKYLVGKIIWVYSTNAFSLEGNAKIRVHSSGHI